MYIVKYIFQANNVSVKAFKETGHLGTEHESTDKEKDFLEDAESKDDPWKISTVYIKVVPWDGK